MANPFIQSRAIFQNATGSISVSVRECVAAPAVRSQAEGTGWLHFAGIDDVRAMRIDPFRPAERSERFTAVAATARALGAAAALATTGSPRRQAS